MPNPYKQAHGPLIPKPKVFNLLGLTKKGEKKARVAKKNMDWLTAKRAFPTLGPYGDADGDGVINMFDCKPFDRRRQDDPNMQPQINQRPMQSPQQMQQSMRSPPPIDIPEDWLFKKRKPGEPIY